MKILILGGSGILSTDFTKKVLDSGDSVTIVNRGKRKAFIDPRAKLLVADLRQESEKALSQKLATQEYDVVVDFLSYNVDHLRKNLNIIRSKCKQYIFISSATAYKKCSEDEIITEKTPVGNQKWDYAYQKALCEQYLEKENIDYTIIRPYVTYGDSRIPFQIIPDGAHYTLLQRIKEEKPVILLDDGRAVCTLTHTTDFAEVLYRLLLNAKAYRQAFHITNSCTYTWKEVYETLCRILEKPTNVISVSLEDVKKYLPEYYPSLSGDKGTNMQFDNSKVMQAIGEYQFAVDLEAGLRRSVAYYETHENMQRIEFRWDGKVDYCIQKNSGRKLSCLKIRNSYSCSPMLYFVVRYQPFRGMYNFLKGLYQRLR